MVRKFFMALACIMIMCGSAQAFYNVYAYLAPDKPAFDGAAKEPPKRVIPKDAPELILVNKSVRLLKEYEPGDLVLVKGVYLRRMAAQALVEMMDAAKQEGISGIVAISGYRSYATQSEVHASKIVRLRSEYGDGAKDEAEKLVAPAGASEHQTGLAVDLSLSAFLKYEYVLNYDFAKTAAGCWLKDNAWKYGFVLRYAEDKTEKTGFSYEPWHFRYVGVEHAKVMYEENLCLEEYLAP